MRFVASQMMPAVFDQTTMDITATGHDGAVYTLRETGSVPKFDGFLAVYEEGKDQKDEEDEELKHRLPAGGRGREPQVPLPGTRAAFHRASAALHRSHAGQGTGSRRRGPAVDLRLHPLHHPGARVRQEGRRPLRSHRARHGGDRPAARELRRHLRRHLHRPHGGGARRNRRGQAGLARWPWPSSTRSSATT